MISQKLHATGQWLLLFISRLGSAGLLLWRILYRRPRFKKTLLLVLTQLYAIGALSLVIIIFSATFVGMVVTLQGYTTLAQFGSTARLGIVLALSITRELGPVIAALLFAGRTGSALAAEIGLMKTTEQLSSLEIMGVDPVWFIASPRFWAAVISMPLLTLIFNASAILGGSVIGIDWLNIDAGSFWSNMQDNINFYPDIVNGIIKSIIFGAVIAWIAVYQGMECAPTAAGISLATTRTVVYSSLAVLSLDFILTAIMLGWL